MTRVLGLTGGIASGKTTVSDYFKALNIPVVDADIIAREVMKAGEPTVLEIEKQFGAEVIQENGEINRKRLGEIIFASSKKREQLNQIVQGVIRENILKEKNALIKEKYPLIVLDLPLLYEEAYEKEVDEVMVVSVGSETQCDRLLKRNPQLSRDEATDRIRSQMPLSLKAKRADILIDNNGTVEDTLKQVDRWLAKNFNEKDFAN